MGSIGDGPKEASTAGTPIPSLKAAGPSLEATGASVEAAGSWLGGAGASLEAAGTSSNEEAEEWVP